VPLSSARQNKEYEKGLFNTNKQKTNTSDVLLLKQLKLAKRLGKITGRLPLLFWH
jgi:hypothetical protein